MIVNPIFPIVSSCIIYSMLVWHIMFWSMRGIWPSVNVHVWVGMPESYPSPYHHLRIMLNMPVVVIPWVDTANHGLPFNLDPTALESLNYDFPTAYWHSFVLPKTMASALCGHLPVRLAYSYYYYYYPFALVQGLSRPANVRIYGLNPSVTRDKRVAVFFLWLWVGSHN